MQNFQFKNEWGEELVQYFEDNPDKKDAINSIMASRNQIVHGKQCSISVHDVRTYLEKAVKVVAFIENQCANRAV
ncbi:MAG: hypothetical protein GY862_28485 [Gammaproteobacteria bacterium]|nr:hypothetical protein [Gammaproteobacteria bacterium]